MAHAVSRRATGASHKAPAVLKTELARLEVAIVRLTGAIDHARGQARPDDAAPHSGTGCTRLYAALSLVTGIDQSVRNLLSALPPTGDSAPLTAENAARAMAYLGLAVRREPSRAAATALTRDGEWTGGPSLFIPDALNGEPVVVFACPDTGQGRVIGLSGPSRLLVPGSSLGPGTLWSFHPADEHRLDASQRAHTGASWFRALLSGFEQAGLALLLCSLGVALVALLIPFFTIQTYAQVISLGSPVPMPGFIIGMLLAIAIEAALLTQRKSIVAFIAARVDYLIGTMSFERLLKLRASLSERSAATDQASRLRTVENIRDFATGPGFAAIMEAPASLCAVAAIAVLASWVALVPVIAILAHISVFALMRRQARIRTSIAADESTEMQRITIETFEKRDVIREAGLSHQWSERMVSCARRQQTAQMGLRLIGARAESLSTLVLISATALLLIGGTRASWAGLIGPGGLLAIIILGLRALTPFHTLCLSVLRFEQLSNAVKQLNTLMDLPTERDPTRIYTDLRAPSGAVTFLNVGFRGGDTRPVFVGLDLDIAPGDKVAITGANGTGKTTILKLVLGLSDLALGALRIDGVDLRQLAANDLRRKIAYIPQSPKLFPGTVRENLLFASPLASVEHLARVVQDCEIEEHLSTISGGLDAPLSAVEIEALPAELVTKIAIGRALLVNARVILIDEVPNGLLDGPVGNLVRKLIVNGGRISPDEAGPIAAGEPARGRATIVFVSHRSDFLSLAQRVVALRYGKVPTISTPKSLLESRAL